MSVINKLISFLIIISFFNITSCKNPNDTEHPDVVTTRDEISYAFTSYGVTLSEEELDYFEDEYNSKITVTEIYNAVVKDFIFYQEPGYAMESISLYDFRDSLQEMVDMRGSQEYEEADLDIIFENITDISTSTGFRTHQAVLLTSIIMQVGNALTDSTFDPNLAPINARKLNWAKKALLGTIIFATAVTATATVGVLVAGGAVIAAPIIAGVYGGTIVAGLVTGMLYGSAINDYENAVDSMISGTNYDEMAVLDLETGNVEVEDYLTDYSSSSRFITIEVYDHGSIDGDRISISVNRQIVESDISLVGSPGTSVDITLKSGRNSITVKALNQGTAGDNTATLVLPNGDTTSWYLTTGEKASVFMDY